MAIPLDKECLGACKVFAHSCAYWDTRISDLLQVFSPQIPNPIFFRLIRKLSTMPYSYDPHGLIFHAIKKTIWMHNYFAKGKFRKLR